MNNGILFMNQASEPLNPDDVVKLKNDDDKWVMSHTTFTISDFSKTLLEDYNDDYGQWAKGVEDEVLVPGKSWRKGKVRVTLEFIPDVPKSPLDDFRNKPVD
ncbi:KGK domain-containing protein [Cyanobacterium sp. IPPAS B-1200]|uniref:KGK domain-containing protein n=1 Tax=Cyanobacterium sp. IPPAS B-1200 TaxID=1562720 RepID=UPI0008525E62|nr:KGK domain-containing protein [Cyanobacterium sp. IPPAS B-1200]OEJ77905.1 hypothetical protein A5482_14595 [Cyanobacterium sp. IPPAS B-1200]